MNPEITYERESRFEQEVAAGNYGSEGVDGASATNVNSEDMASISGKSGFKLVDVGVIHYLKLVHTELYEKLKAAVYSITNKNN